ASSRAWVRSSVACLAARCAVVYACSAAPSVTRALATPAAAERAASCTARWALRTPSCAFAICAAAATCCCTDRAASAAADADAHVDVPAVKPIGERGRRGETRVRAAGVGVDLHRRLGRDARELRAQLTREPGDVRDDRDRNGTDADRHVVFLPSRRRCR